MFYVLLYVFVFYVIEYWRESTIPKRLTSEALSIGVILFFITENKGPGHQ